MQNKSTYICIECKRFFERYACLVTSEDRVCCSRKCAGLYKKRTSRRYLVVEMNCDHCGTPVQRVVKTMQGRLVYCNRFCAGQSKSVDPEWAAKKRADKAKQDQENPQKHSAETRRKMAEVHRKWWASASEAQRKQHAEHVAQALQARWARQRGKEAQDAAHSI